MNFNIFNIDIRNILEIPSAYQLLQSIVRSEKHIIKYVENYIKPNSGDKILDIGCGTSDILNFLPSVEYTGFDANPKYIEKAFKTFAGKGTFYCKNVSHEVIEELCLADKFDIVIANNVLHHLNNSEAQALFQIAQKALRHGGRMITCDPSRIEGSGLISRIIVSLDRGKFVRTPNEYVSLAKNVFNNCEYKEINTCELSHIQISGVIMECRNFK